MLPGVAETLEGFTPFAMTAKMFDPFRLQVMPLTRLEEALEIACLTYQRAGAADVIGMPPYTSSGLALLAINSSSKTGSGLYTKYLQREHD